MITGFVRLENIAEKEKNVGYQHFLIFVQLKKKKTFP